MSRPALILVAAVVLNACAHAPLAGRAPVSASGETRAAAVGAALVELLAASPSAPERVALVNGGLVLQASRTMVQVEVARPDGWFRLYFAKGDAPAPQVVTNGTTGGWALFEEELAMAGLGLRTERDGELLRVTLDPAARHPLGRAESRSVSKVEDLRVVVSMSGGTAYEAWFRAVDELASIVAGARQTRSSTLAGDFLVTRRVELRAPDGAHLLLDSATDTVPGLSGRRVRLTHTTVDGRVYRLVAAASDGRADEESWGVASLPANGSLADSARTIRNCGLEAFVDESGPASLVTLQGSLEAVRRCLPVEP